MTALTPTRFLTSWKEAESPNRYGLPWSTAEREKLLEMYDARKTLKQICEALERPAAGVIAKLVEFKCIYLDRQAGTYDVYFRNPARPDIETQPPKLKAPTMATKAAPVIETKTFIGGIEAAELTDLQVFAEIGKLEDKIAKFKTIKTPSVKLNKLIAAMEIDVLALAKFVDARETV